MTHMVRTEPRLEDLLDDPLVRLLMERDAVDPSQVSAMFKGLRQLRRPNDRSPAENGARDT